MAISFINAATATNPDGTGASSVSVNKPTDTADGDLMLCLISHSDSGDPVTLSGWAFVNTTIISGNNFQTSLYVKVASSEGSSYTWDVGPNNSTQPLVVAISTWRGTHGVHVVGSNTGSAVTSHTTPDVTIESGSSGLPLYLGVSRDASNTIGVTHTAASGTEVFDVGSDNGSYTIAQAAYYGTTATAGTVSGVSITRSESVGDAVGFTVVLAETGTATFNFEVSGSWLCPTDVSEADVLCVGGGGGGGAGTANPGSGGGGAGGASARKSAFAVSAGTSYTVTIAAATGQATTGGATGNTSWFSSNDTNGVVAVGGPGGAEGTSTVLGGAGGTGTATGCFGTAFAGGSGSSVATDLGGSAGGGAAGLTAVGGDALVSAAGTGNAPGGNGAAGKAVSTSPGNAGVAPGGGGGGGNTTVAGNSNGGIGARGLIRVIATKTAGGGGPTAIAAKPKLVSAAAVNRSFNW